MEVGADRCSLLIVLQFLQWELVESWLPRTSLPFLPSFSTSVHTHPLRRQVSRSTDLLTHTRRAQIAHNARTRRSRTQADRRLIVRTSKRTHGHTDTRTHGHTDTHDTRTHGHTDTRTHGHTDTRTRGRADARTRSLGLVRRAHQRRSTEQQRTRKRAYNARKSKPTNKLDATTKSERVRTSALASARVRACCKIYLACLVDLGKKLSACITCALLFCFLSWTVGVCFERA